jgi:Alpha/beta hydrolase domain
MMPNGKCSVKTRPGDHFYYPARIVGHTLQDLCSQDRCRRHDIDGIRGPSVSVLIATYTGWGLRAGNAADPVSIVDGCDATGQYLPFPNTIAQRKATGDPRPSLQERYGNSAGTNADYVAKVQEAAEALVAPRLLIEEPGVVQDVEFYTTPAMSVAIPAKP